MIRSLAFILLLAGSAANAEGPLSGCTELSGEALKSRFSNVRDDATIVDGAGGNATNFWYADGRMTSAWQTQTQRGFISARWTVTDNQRCVSFEEPLPDGSLERCGPLYLCDGVVTTTNPTGGVHGRHHLTPISRLVALNGTNHTRDLGGYRTPDGRLTRYGLLLRSDGLGELSEPDRLTLSAIGVRQITDLRTPAEQNHAPSSLCPHFQPAIRTLDLNDPQLDTLGLGRRIASGTIQDTELERLLDRSRISEDRELLNRLGSWIRGLLEPNAVPHLFHCTAGKDRTGITAAVLLMALGVEMAEVRRDFMASNSVLKDRIASQFNAIVDAGYTGRSAPLEGVLGVSEESFDSLVRGIEAHWKTVDNFVENGLGLTPLERSQLQTLLLYRP